MLWIQEYFDSLTIDPFNDILTILTNDFISKESIFLSPKIQTWIMSILASCAVGLSGILPLILIPIEYGINLKKEPGSRSLRLLLSFAVGGLLGDVFLHLLPEAWGQLAKGQANVHHQYFTLSCWVLMGIFIFVVMEIVFVTSDNSAVATISTEVSKGLQHSNGSFVNGSSRHPATETDSVEPLEDKVQVTGYLNLLANSIDNFTHGLAVAASFLVGTKMGLLTTFAILIHEIPHEVGDFAILLKSGFTRWQAAQAQMSTASVGVLGTIMALWVDSTEALGDYTGWILPFTSGGFLNIALVSILPDLIKEEDPWESMKQLACICCGILVMGAVSTIL